MFDGVLFRRVNFRSLIKLLLGFANKLANKQKVINENLALCIGIRRMSRRI